jgi:chromosome segregation ATPase
LIKTELNNKYTEIKELSREYEKALETKEQYKVYYEKMRNEVVKLKAELEKKHEGSESLKLENELLKSNNKALQHQMTTLCQQQQPQQYMQPSYPRQAQN